MKTPVRLDAFETIPAVHIYQVDQEVNEDVKLLLTHPETYYYDDSQNVWEKNLPELNKLFQTIVYCVANYTQLDLSQHQMQLDGWCVTTPDSNTHLQKHDHSGHADLVVTYYAVNDNPEGQGDIILFETEHDTCTLQYRPHPGALVIFPGHWPHQVTPYTGIRLSVATNVRIIKRHS